MTFTLCCGHGLNIEGVVDQCEFVLGGKAGLDEGEMAEFLLYELMDYPQAVRVFRMARTGDVLHIAVVLDDSESRHFILKEKSAFGLISGSCRITM